MTFVYTLAQLNHWKIQRTLLISICCSLMLLNICSLQPTYLMGLTYLYCLKKSNASIKFKLISGSDMSEKIFFKSHHRFLSIPSFSARHIIVYIFLPTCPIILSLSSGLQTLDLTLYVSASLGRLSSQIFKAIYL